MKTKIKFFLCLFLLTACISCKKNMQKNTPQINVDKIPSEGFVINKWHVVGPFLENSRNNIIDTNLLKLFGLNETTLDFKKFCSISKNMIKDTTQIDTNFVSVFLFSDKYPVELDNLFNIKNNDYKCVVYFACEIRCKRNIETRLHFSSSDGQKIWLNNELICMDDRPKPVLSYEQYIPINLKKGSNILLIKLHRIDNIWEMYTRLENTSEKGLKRYFGLHNHWILQHSVTFDLDSNYLDKVFPLCNGKITIFDCNRHILYTDSIYEGRKWAISNHLFKDGLYKAEFKTGKIVLEHDFYKGDIHDTINKLINLLNRVDIIPEKRKNNIDALIFRYNHLLTKTYRSDKKYVYLFMELNHAYNYFKRGIDPYHHTTGCFIRSYISDIDNSKQYYILHVPSTYNKERTIPAAFIIPAIVWKLTYLESFRVANTKLIEFFQDLSEKYEIIIIEPGSRRYNKPNYNTIEEAELFNILSDVEKDYNIDKKRLYLAGTCSAGNEIIKLAVQYPDVFAAIGMVAPEIIYPEEINRPIQTIEYLPVFFIKNLINMPFFNTHSLIDRHVSVERSEILDKLVKKENIKKYKYVKIPNEFPKYYPDDFFDDIFEYVTQHSLNLSPEEVYFSTSQMLYNKSFWITLNEIIIPEKAIIHARIKRNKIIIKKENIISYSIDLKTLPYNKSKKLTIEDNGEIVYKGFPKDTILYFGIKKKSDILIKNKEITGPFSHVFTKKFIVVKGTTGNKVEVLSIKAIADTINKYWYDRYFTSCLIKNDYEINEDDIQNANLILLGNFNSNLVLKKIEANIPLKISTEFIKIGNKEIKGNSLCFYMIYPNPLNRKKYVAIIGYNNSENISLGYEKDYFNDISDYGWFDYKVWEYYNPSLPLIDGYFNHYWKTEINQQN